MSFLQWRVNFFFFLRKDNSSVELKQPNTAITVNILIPETKYVQTPCETVRIAWLGNEYAFLGSTQARRERWGLASCRKSLWLQLASFLGALTTLLRAHCWGQLAPFTGVLDVTACTVTGLQWSCHWLMFNICINIVKKWDVYTWIEHECIGPAPGVMCTAACCFFTVTASVKCQLFSMQLSHHHQGRKELCALLGLS